MKYKTLDGAIMVSDPNKPVVHKFVIPEYNEVTINGKVEKYPISYDIGTHISFETSNKADNSLQQMKIVRVYDEDRNATVTITESTQQEISEYITNVSLNQ